MRVSTACLALLFTAAPLAALAANSSAGCGADGWQSGIYSMTFEGISRTFRVYVPKNYEKNNAAPLITLFHGWNYDEDEFLRHEEVRAGADRRGYILVAPRGLGSGDPDQSFNSWAFSGSTTGLDGDGDKICDDHSTPDYAYSSCALIKQNRCSWTHCQQNDVDFVVALVEHIEENLCVDENRVFAMGGSNGGMLSWELGQNPESAPTFRAIAPVIGLPHRGYLQAKGKLGDMPVLVLTGTQDTVVPPGDWDDPGFTTTSNDNDRFYYTGATAITRSWAMAHGCDIDQNAVRFDAGVDQADCRTFCSGDSGWPRVLDCRTPTGHDYELSWAWKLVLDFFDQHSN